MRKKIMTLLVAAMVIGAVGCGVKEEPVDEILESDNSTEISEEVETVTSSTDSSSLSGTWQSISMTGEDKAYPAEYYVQFTDSEINYGSMTDDGKFEVDHSDKIDSMEEVSTGIYRVKAESAKGIQYIYQTSEEDPSVMEYYGTWSEDEFADTYSGGASLTKCD
ncbi:hypothetical protein SAMN02910298_01146 [Pseudobutyrivibrio sp. YE44]|uniref:hypothetical protein n=1 Tax=Pseudobutyrivibrio sp. YE44 TaxID=1520802 RepID=UPI000883A817|nr:hypothetical protein [Pseudobutyrivibrio sp. YE44]SDB23404.1 hypothetical protein SAMN02910298_01146 [Pseudobutyrivibrio sp. YE44]